MKHFALAVLLLVFFGCSERSEPVAEITYDDKIADWQSREVLCQPTSEFTEGYTAKADILNALYPLLLNPPVYAYQDEEGDYWQSSGEMEVNKAGDCEDIAALWYATIRERQIVPDHLLFIRIIKYTDGRCHTVVVIQTDSGELYFSNGVLMSNLNAHTTLAEYDLWSTFLQVKKHQLYQDLKTADAVKQG